MNNDDEFQDKDYDDAFHLLVIRTVALFIVGIFFIGLFIFSLIKGW
jgi:hypothetical protein